MHTTITQLRYGEVKWSIPVLQTQISEPVTSYTLYSSSPVHDLLVVHQYSSALLNIPWSVCNAGMDERTDGQTDGWTNQRTDNVTRTWIQELWIHDPTAREPDVFKYVTGTCACICVCTWLCRYLSACLYACVLERLFACLLPLFTFINLLLHFEIEIMHDKQILITAQSALIPSPADL